jgi:Ca2+-binding EF-hand superfamily protein
MICRFDLDSDGMLSFDEFKTIFMSSISAKKNESLESPLPQRIDTQLNFDHILRQ